MQHARPHLQTHGRSQGHSAVAGAAYRLGLRLYDERAKIWHDFRRRKLGEEIVAALTLAPDGAPDWATDPQELWGRAEAAEKRVDSQVARDYRIPIPLGLSDAVATGMATRMAQFIVDALHTSVSMGLHRDADVDALGALKPKDRQGYHAHLYFPTRKVEQIEQGDGTSAWGLHTKFAFLTGRRSSSDFVERLNEHWAALANEFTAAANLPADYTHLSYVRQDLPIEPQPTLGQAVVAMERKGFFTRKGNALRDIVLPSALYEATHAVVVDAQRRQAVDDAIRERTDPAARAARLVAEAANEPTVAPKPTTTVEPLVQAPLPKPTMTAPAGSLVARFHAAAPEPNTLEERQLFVRVLKIIAVVERVLAALSDLANRFRHHTENRDRRMAAKLDADYQLDGCRMLRASAKDKLEKWEANHRWKVATARAFGRNDGIKPKAWQNLIEAFDASHRRVQALKTSLLSHQAHLDAFAKDEVELKAQQADATERLKAALTSLADVNQAAVEPLLSLANGDECTWLKTALPEMELAPIKSEKVADLNEAVTRLRPAPRRPGMAP